MAFDPSGNLYISNIGGHTIDKFTPGGTNTIFASGFGALGLACDSAGNLYVVTNNSIEKFTPGGVESLFAAGLNGDLYLDFDSSGNFFVTDDRVHRTASQRSLRRPRSTWANAPNCVLDALVCPAALFVSESDST